MSKHDEEFDETISRLSKEMSGFNGLATIQLLKELHEINTSLDFIYDAEVGREDYRATTGRKNSATVKEKTND